MRPDEVDFDVLQQIVALMNQKIEQQQEQIQDMYKRMQKCECDRVWDRD